MVNNKTFELRPVVELFSIVKNDFKKLDEEGLIDDGTLIKTIMHCNDRLGIYIRDVKQVCIPVYEYQAKLPLNFEKLYFVAALRATNTSIIANALSPLENNFDRDIVYEAELDRETIGGVDNYNVIIKRTPNVTVHTEGSWVTLSLSKSSLPQCHVNCPNTKKPGKYEISIDGDTIHTPFRSGELYLMYIGTMQDEFGNILFPFHPMITPYYEWALKEKVLLDAIFNSDGNYGELLKLAQLEKSKAWLDAFNITSDKDYGQHADSQKKKELGWWSQYFKYFQ